jgi:hypothetical protein
MPTVKKAINIGRVITEQTNSRDGKRLLKIKDKEIKI